MPLHVLTENVYILIQVSLNLSPTVQFPIDSTPAVAQVMVWRWTGDKPLPEPMMPQFIDVVWCHQATMC